MSSNSYTADAAYLRRVVLERSHNALDPARDSLFEGKLARLVRSCGLASVHELVERMRRTKNEQLECAVSDAMMVNETSFFRDSRLFDLLQAELLPQLIAARKRSRALRLWSAACSTGQEAYSVAILIREQMRTLGGWKVSVTGTDLTRDALERAREAKYQRIEVSRGLPARYLSKYFECAGESWVVKPDVRALCSFRQLDLCQGSLPFSQRLDVILLRNVLLYFAPHTRRAAMERIAELLAPDGMLLMGATEQPPDMGMWRAEIRGGACVFRKRERG